MIYSQQSCNICKHNTCENILKYSARSCNNLALTLKTILNNLGRSYLILLPKKRYPPPPTKYFSNVYFENIIISKGHVPFSPPIGRYAPHKNEPKGLFPAGSSKSEIRHGRQGVCTRYWRILALCGYTKIRKRNWGNFAANFIK